MPVVRKLDQAEVQTIERKSPGLRKVIETEYDRHLAEFSAGEYGEVDLNEDDNRLTVRNRLKAAAGRHDPPLALMFQHTRGRVIRFLVASQAAAAPAQPAAPAATAPRARSEHPDATLTRRRRKAE